MNLIAVDALGGDQAPSSVIEGVILAKESGVNCVLVGDKREIAVSYTHLTLPTKA